MVNNVKYHLGYVEETLDKIKNPDYDLSDEELLDYFASINHLKVYMRTRVSNPKHKILCGKELEEDNRLLSDLEKGLFGMDVDDGNSNH